MNLKRLFAFLVLCAGCGDEAAAPTYDCAEPARIVVLKRDEMRSTCFDDDGHACELVGIALPQGVTTRLGIAVYDEEKRECDPSLTSASIDDEDFDLVNDGVDVYVTPLTDLFDTEKGVEPSGTLTVRHGDLVSQWRVMAMVDLAGVWEITIDGLVVGDFEAGQSGRFLRWAECPPGDARPECSAGLVYANLVWLQSPIGDLKLEGTIRPARDHIDGHWSNGTGQGNWDARRVPKP
ncbi:MAG TPA: hypothetical protein VJ694_00190 [Patescibacteria group bacterium]|nr:hypothetical protein [Patescibacteria group bacterium]